MNTHFEEFLQLFKDSYIVRALIVLAVTFAVLYLTVTKEPVPELLFNTWFMLLGYFFGIVTGRARARMQ